MNVRFLEHYDVVDLFVVVEAPFSFTGNPKPLHFADALCRRFAPFAAKIVHVVANFTDDVWQKQPIKQDPASNDAWRREFAMRVLRHAYCVQINTAITHPHTHLLTVLQNSFHAVGRVLGLQPRDLLLQSDVDEIPTALGVLTASRLLWNGLSDPVVPLPAVNFHMKQYFYSLQTYEVRQTACSSASTTLCNKYGHPPGCFHVHRPMVASPRASRVECFSMTR